MILIFTQWVNKEKSSMKQDLDIVLACLHKLSQAELKIVTARLRVLNIGSGEANEIYGIVADMLGGAIIPLPVARQSKHFTRFVKGVDVLMDFYTTHFKSVKYRPMRLKVLKVLISCATGSLKNEGFKLTFVNIGDRLARIQECVENCFPGYLAAGCLLDAITK